MVTSFLVLLELVVNVEMELIVLLHALLLVNLEAVQLNHFVNNESMNLELKDISAKVLEVSTNV